MMLVSFTQQKSITRLKNGSYFAQKPVTLSEADAKTLFDMTKSSFNETTVVHQTIWKHKDGATLKYKGQLAVTESAKAAASETTVVHETIWQHKSSAKLKLSKQELVTVNSIMAKYSN
jgi:hypothetical protein